MENKKTTRKVIGSVLTSKDNPKEFYIKVNEDAVLKKGSFLRLESAAQQLASAEKAHAEGKLSEEAIVSIRERIGKIPEFVKFQVIKLDQVSS